MENGDGTRCESSNEFWANVGALEIVGPDTKQDYPVDRGGNLLLQDVRGESAERARS